MNWHTPGPWEWRGKSGSLHRDTGERNSMGNPVYGETVLYPSYEYESGVDTIVSDADARLIATAPILLEACLIAVEHCQYSHIREILHNAIAKATQS